MGMMVLVPCSVVERDGDSVHLNHFLVLLQFRESYPLVQWEEDKRLAALVLEQNWRDWDYLEE